MSGPREQQNMNRFWEDLWIPDGKLPAKSYRLYNGKVSFSVVVCWVGSLVISTLNEICLGMKLKIFCDHLLSTLAHTHTTHTCK